MEVDWAAMDDEQLALLDRENYRIISFAEKQIIFARDNLYAIAAEQLRRRIAREPSPTSEPL